MNYTKINISKLKKLIKEKEVNSTTAELLLSSVALANAIVEKFESKEVDFLLKTKTREGHDKYIVNPLLSSYMQVINTIDKLLKSSKIIVTHYTRKPEPVQEEPQEDTFLSIMKSLKS